MSETPVTPEPVEQEAPTSSGAGKKVLSIVAAIVFIGLAIAWKTGVVDRVWDSLTGGITSAVAGDCVNEFVKVEDAKVVDCTSADAKYKVAGVVDGVSQKDFDNPTKQQALCEAYPTWDTVVWTGTAGGSGDIWCLEPLG